MSDSGMPNLVDGILSTVWGLGRQGPAQHRKPVGPPAIISVYQRDTPATHDAFELTVVFARFLLPQIFFYGVFSIFGQVLNARNRCGAMTWTPVLNNLVLIAMFGLYLGLMTAPEQVSDITDAQVGLLGAGTTLALALQALALIPYAHAAGFRFRPRFDWRGTGQLHRSVHQHHRNDPGPLPNQSPDHRPRISTPDGGQVTGSSRYWCGIQAIGHRNPVARLQVRTGNGRRQRGDPPRVE